MKSYFLNCLAIHFSDDQIEGRTCAWNADTDIKAIRKRFGKEWFIIRRGSIVFGLPKNDNPSELFGDEDFVLNISKYRGLDLLRTCLNDAMPDFLPKYQPDGVRPFRFLAQRDEFVSSFAKKNTIPPIVAEGFKIHPRFEMDARMIECVENERKIVIAISVRMKWEILACIDDLADASVQLRGLYVILRNPKPGEHRLVGRIKNVVDGNVELSESMNGRKSIPSQDVQLEGSLEGFSRCLSKLLGKSYRSFEYERGNWEFQYTSGPGYEKILRTLSARNDSLRLTGEMCAQIGDLVTLKNNHESTIFKELDAVQYCFDAAKTKRNVLPWNGLLEHGPFDGDTFEKRNPRILVVVPQSQQNKAEQVLAILLDGIPGGQYSAGLSRLFNLRQVKLDTCPIPDHRLLVKEYYLAYRKAIEDHLSGDHTYDAAFVVMPDFCKQIADRFNPYLHAKSLLLTNGIPSQGVRYSTLHENEVSLQYALRNIAVSLYAKMDGTPWTVSQPRTYNDEIVIGMGMAEVAGSRVVTRQRHMGITTVFLGDGNFLLSNVSKECSYEEYPDVLKETTKTVLQEVKRRNGWQPGDRVRIVFHSSKPLKNVEIDELIEECVSEVAGEQIVEFASLQVSQHHPFKVYNAAQNGIRWGKGKKGEYVPDRGFVLQLGASTRLLSTNGPYQIKKPITPLPAPLLIHLHRRSTSRSLDALTEQILKFTSLTWRSTNPAAIPVTIYYSELIADLLARFREMPDWSPAMLNTKLRASKWFL